MRLSDKDIQSYLDDGQLIIVGPRTELPFDKYSQVQACSIDLRLDNRFLKFKDTVQQFDVKDLDNVWNYVDEFRVEDGQPIVLQPQTILFGQIYEQLRLPSDVSGKIVGRSRFARLGVSIHATGDFVNPEFEGAMPLQIFNHNLIPIVIYPYMTVCQLVLIKLTSPPLVPYPLRTSNPYHRETNASPSVLHTDPVLTGKMQELTIHSVVEKRLVDNYLRDRERVKLMEELAKGKNSEDQSNLPQGQGGTIVINNSTIGALTSGQLIGDIKSKIETLNESAGFKNLGDVLTQLVEFIQKNESRLDSDQQQESLELVDELARQASVPVAKRSSPGVVKSIISNLGDIIKIASSGTDLWSKWGPGIMEFFKL
jgi:dCTP deaminase